MVFWFKRSLCIYDSYSVYMITGQISICIIIRNIWWSVLHLLTEHGPTCYFFSFLVNKSCLNLIGYFTLSWREPHQMCICLRMHQQHVFITWSLFSHFRKLKSFALSLEDWKYSWKQGKFNELAQSQEVYARRTNAYQR